MPVMEFSGINDKSANELSVTTALKLFNFYPAISATVTPIEIA
jgi:hypothetical protein